MNKEDAKSLVTKLINASFVAGKHSTNPDSLVLESESKKALKLGDEIIRLLTSRRSRAADVCGCKDGGRFMLSNICMNCGGVKPLPAYVDSMDNKVQLVEVDD